MTSYRVEKGLNYKATPSSDEVRAEVGDTISDIPSSAIKGLLAINAISEVVETPTEEVVPDVVPEVVQDSVPDTEVAQ